MKKEYFESQLSPEMKKTKKDGYVFTFPSADRYEPAKNSTDENEDRSTSRIKALIRYARGLCQSAETNKIVERLEARAAGKMDLNDLHDGSFDDVLAAEILEIVKQDPTVTDDLSRLEENVQKSFKTPINARRKSIAAVLNQQDKEVTA